MAVSCRYSQGAESSQLWRSRSSSSLSLNVVSKAVYEKQAERQAEMQAEEQEKRQATRQVTANMHTLLGAITALCKLSAWPTQRCSTTGHTPSSINQIRHTFSQHAMKACWHCKPHSVTMPDAVLDLSFSAKYKTRRQRRQEAPCKRRQQHCKLRLL